jgi:cytochrome P450
MSHQPTPTPSAEPFDFNPFDAETRRDPYAIFARARRERPVFVHEGFPIVSLFRFADIQALLKDPQTFSSSFPPPPGMTREDLPPPSMLGQNPPEHTRLRSLVSQAFTPRIIRGLEPRLRAVADELFDEALEKGEVDFVEAMTYPLPVIAIAEIIGVPASDRNQFKSWSDTAVEDLGTGLFVPPSRERMQKMGSLLTEMGEYFSALADERRRQPREDLLTGLVQAEVEGSKLSHQEMIQMMVLLLVAGNETTTSLIGNVVLELLDHPDELARLRADPDLSASAVEEVLRFSSPVQMDPRFIARDTEIGGVKLEAGRFAVSWLGSANRDEDIFERAQEFDIARTDNRHIGFGFGIHYCLGANLARLEARVALDHLIARTRSFERIGSDPLPMHPSIVFRGVTELPLRLRPA